MNNLTRRSKLFVKRNAPTILTVLGGVGVVATSVTAVRATPKAIRLLEEAKKEKGDELTVTEKVRTAGVVYVPSVLVGVSTIACIFGANALNKRNQAALMSAYAFLDSSYKEYKDKVKELYGEDANEHIHSEISKDKYKETDIVVSDNKQLFYDAFSKRFFESTMEDVLKAEYDVNRQLQLEGGVLLNEFYEYLDIPYISSGMELGWSPGILESMYWTYWIDFHHTELVTDDGVPYRMITMQQEPVIDYAYY